MSDSVRPLFTLAGAFAWACSTTLGVTPASAAGKDVQHALSANACLSALDATAVLIQRRDPSVRNTVTALIEQCPDLPQLHHNLALLDARDQDWDAAVTQLEQAIALDQRAAGSVSALRGIQSWRAAQAYARALGGQPLRAAPALALQTSQDINSDTRRLLQPEPDLHDTTVVDYELWEWWRSAESQLREPHLEHYTGHDATSALLAMREQDELPDWDQVDRQVRFLGRDAMATVSWTSPASGQSQHLVLLMHLQADRWLIYDELQLP